MSLLVIVMAATGCLFGAEYAPLPETPSCTPTDRDELCAMSPCSIGVDDGCGGTITCSNCETCLDDAPPVGGMCSAPFDCCDPIDDNCTGGLKCALTQALLEAQPDGAECDGDRDCETFDGASCVRQQCVIPAIGHNCNRFDESISFVAKEGEACEVRPGMADRNVGCEDGAHCVPTSLDTFVCVRFCELQTGAGCERSIHNACETEEALPLDLGAQLTAQGYGTCRPSCRGD